MLNELAEDNLKQMKRLTEINKTNVEHALSSFTNEEC